MGGIGSPKAAQVRQKVSLMRQCENMLLRED